MVDDDQLEQIADALTKLASGAHSATPWRAMGSLAALSAGDLDLTIDFRATARLGAPLVLARAREESQLLALLSPREQQVARCIQRGLANRAIAYELHISIGTVKDHVHNILAKTGRRSRAELAAQMGGASAQPRPTGRGARQSIEG